MLKHIVQSSDVVGQKSEYASKRLALCHSLLGVMGIASVDEIDMSKRSSKDINEDSEVIVQMGRIIAWKNGEQKEMKKNLVDSVRDFAMQMFLICADDEDARNLAEAVHCAIIDSSNIACALVCPVVAGKSSIRFLRWALMSLFVVLRGICTSLSRELQCKVKPANFLPTLYKIVPLLTKFSQHGDGLAQLRLGGTQGKSLSKFLLHFLQNRSELGLQKSLIQVWLRQLATQEGWGAPDVKLLSLSSSQYPTPPINTVMKVTGQASNEKPLSSADSQSCAHNSGGWNGDECNCNFCSQSKKSYQNLHDKACNTVDCTTGKTLQDSSGISEENLSPSDVIREIPKLSRSEGNALRYDGCIYMAKMLRILTGNRQSTGDNEPTKTYDTRCEMIFRLTSYFFYHFLICHGKIRREHLGAAVLASISLGGKNEDNLISIARLIKKSRGLPPPPGNENDTANSEGKDVISSELNDPVASIFMVKVYELQIMNLVGFCQDTSSIHPISYLAEFRCLLGLDSKAEELLISIIDDKSYTHSGLCLLDQPRVVLAGIYFLACDKMGINMHQHWADILDINGGSAYVVREVAKHMWAVRDHVQSRQTISSTSNSKQDETNEAGAPDIIALAKRIRKKDKLLDQAKRFTIEQSPGTPATLDAPLSAPVDTSSGSDDMFGEVTIFKNEEQVIVSSGSSKVASLATIGPTISIPVTESPADISTMMPQMETRKCSIESSSLNGVCGENSAAEESFEVNSGANVKEEVPTIEFKKDEEPFEIEEQKRSTDVQKTMTFESGDKISDEEYVVGAVRSSAIVSLTTNADFFPKEISDGPTPTNHGKNKSITHHAGSIINADSDVKQEVPAVVVKKDEAPIKCEERKIIDNATDDPHKAIDELYKADDVRFLGCMPLIAKTKEITGDGKATSELAGCNDNLLNQSVNRNTESKGVKTLTRATASDCAKRNLGEGVELGARMLEPSHMSKLKKIEMLRQKSNEENMKKFLERKQRRMQQDQSPAVKHGKTTVDSNIKKEPRKQRRMQQDQSPAVKHGKTTVDSNMKKEAIRTAEMNRAVTILNGRTLHYGRKLHVLPNMAQSNVREPHNLASRCARTGDEKLKKSEDFTTPQQCNLVQLKSNIGELMLSVHNLSGSMSDYQFEFQVRKASAIEGNELSFAHIEKKENDGFTGFLRFNDPDIAYLCCQQLQGKFMGGGKIYLKPCHMPKSAFICNLPNGFSERRMIQDYIRNHGLHVVKVGFLGITMKKLNYCVVEFRTQDDLKLAVSILHGSNYNGVKLLVQHCSEVPTHSQSEYRHLRESSTWHRFNSSNQGGREKRKRKKEKKKKEKRKSSSKSKKQRKKTYQEHRIRIT